VSETSSGIDSLANSRCSIKSETIAFSDKDLLHSKQYNSIKYYNIKAKNASVETWLYWCLFVLFTSIHPVNLAAITLKLPFVKLLNTEKVLITSL